MEKKKIAIIAHGCRAGGGLVATLNLLRAFKDVTENEDVLLVCSAGYGYEEIQLPVGGQLYVYRGSQSPIARQWFERVTLPKIIDAYGPDVIFGPGNIGLTRPKAPQAIFIAMPYLLYDRKTYYPNAPLQERLRFAALKGQITKSIKNGTNLIFVQTPIVQKRVADTFNYPLEKIKVLKLPAPAEIQHPNNAIVPPVFESAADTFYVLMMTRYLIHRNPDVLIPLCLQYGHDLRERKIKFITTLTADECPQADRFLANIGKYDLEDIIINVGQLSRADVARYLTHSQLLWLPTMMETLCLPFLEAMTIGTPIMAPELDFARYVCGDAAIYYDPWDIDSMYNCLLKLRSNEPLRKQYGEKSKKEMLDTTKFAPSWQAAAKFTITSLLEIAK
jgi:glycosyltransferase involved in cell wall biosynthesis